MAKGTRFARFTALAALLAVVMGSAAWSGSEQTARTHEVQMTNAGGMVRFEPRDIRIAVGDTVKWILAGGSHNVVFWADSVPQGALPLLRTAMRDTAAAGSAPVRFVGDTAARIRTAGDTYTVVFAGMPRGVYKYYCHPHLGRGMVATITVE